MIREQGEGAKQKNDASDVVIYKVEVPANRCVCVCMCESNVQVAIYQVDVV